MIHVQTDIIKDTITPLLKDLSARDFKRIAKKMLSRGLQIVKKEARKDVSGKVLHKKTGNLAKGFTYKLFGDFNAIIKNYKPHAHLHEYGAHPIAKKAPYLVFEVNGHWVKVKEVTIQARPFLITHLEGFPDKDVLREMEKTMEKEFKKIEERYQ